MALVTLALANCALANETNETAVPVTARDFYNAGTKSLAVKKFPVAEQMFESALAAQDPRVQPPALYNLGHTRFEDGADLLKKGPDAQKAATQGNGALASGENSIRTMESALAGTNVEKMVAAYLEGRGTRRSLHEAEKAVQTAMETYGTTLQKWQRSADDFKSAAELNPADTNAAHNAEIVERHIARLVDSLRKMQGMAMAMGRQRQDMNKLLGQLKGNIPAQNAPPGGGGDDDEDVQPESLAGQKENDSREGGQMPVSISPDLAAQILDGLPLDGARQLNISDQQGGPPKDRTGRNW